MKMYCPVCDTIIEHYSLGTMDYGKQGIFEYYNCTLCHDTLAKISDTNSNLEIKLGEKTFLEDE